MRLGMQGELCQSDANNIPSIDGTDNDAYLTADRGKRLNEEMNLCENCNEIELADPSHSTYTNACDWKCKDDYFQRGLQCEPEITECDGIGETVNKDKIMKHVPIYRNMQSLPRQHMWLGMQRWLF